MSQKKYFIVLVSLLLSVEMALGKESDLLSELLLNASPNACVDEDILAGHCDTEANLHLYSLTESEYADIVNRLMPVWKVASERNVDALLTFTSDPDPVRQDAAWRGLMNTDIESDSEMDQLWEAAFRSQSPVRWFALGNHPLKPDQLRHLESFINEPGIDSLSIAGVLHVLGMQGDEESHQWLKQSIPRFQAIQSSAKVRYALALSVSRSLIQHGSTPELGEIIARMAVEADDARIQSAWMYGWYRSADRNPSESAIHILSRWAENEWHELHGLTRQYLIAILIRNSISVISGLFDQEYLSTIHSLEAIQAANAFGAQANWTEDTEHILATFLQHDSPSVQQATLLTIVRQQQSVSDFLKTRVRQQLREQKNMHPALKLSYLQTEIALTRAVSQTSLQRISFNLLLESNPAVIPQYLNFLSAALPRPQALDSVLTFSETLEPDRVAHEQAYRYLLQHIAGQSYEILSNAHAERLEAFFDLATTFKGSRISLDIHRALESEAAFSRIFGDQLAGIAQQGRESLDKRDSVLVIPDPELLIRLGPAPIWTIHTTMGSLRLRLDPLRSPSTVTAFVKLTQDGLHDASPFHRVVPNFVVQAGEVWTDESNGGTLHRIPTEASEKSFVRGTLGVASAGRDTEGSQFFVMHMWHPHLDSGYTNFGYLLDGHDVLDNLLQGVHITGTTLTPGW